MIALRHQHLPLTFGWGQTPQRGLPPDEVPVDHVGIEVTPEVLERRLPPAELVLEVDEEPLHAWQSLFRGMLLRTPCDPSWLTYSKCIINGAPPDIASQSPTSTSSCCSISGNRSVSHETTRSSQGTSVDAR